MDHSTKLPLRKHMDSFFCRLSSLLKVPHLSRKKKNNDNLEEIQTEDIAQIDFIRSNLCERLWQVEDKHKMDLIYFCNKLIFILVEDCSITSCEILIAINKTLDYFELGELQSVIDCHPFLSSCMEHPNLQKCENVLSRAECVESVDDLEAAHFLFVHQLLYGEKGIFTLLKGSKHIFSEFVSLNGEWMVEEPWHLVNILIKKVNRLSNQELVDQAHDRWFLDSLTIERIVVHPAPDIFSHFMTVIERNLGKEELYLQHVNWIFGLIEFLSKLISISDSEGTLRSAKVAGRELLKLFSCKHQKEQGMPFTSSEHFMPEDLLKAMEYLMGESNRNRLRSRCTVSFLSQGHEPASMN